MVSTFKQIVDQSGKVVNPARGQLDMVQYVYMVITFSMSIDQPGKVVNPARGELSREYEYFPFHVRA